VTDRERELKNENFRTNQVESGDEAAHRFAKLLVAAEKREAELREAISTLIRHLTGYDVADEFDAAEFRELQPRSWALYQKALKEPVENK